MQSISTEKWRLLPFAIILKPKLFFYNDFRKIVLEKEMKVLIC